MSLTNFKLYRQHDQMDCGPTCLRMVARYYGRSYSLESLTTKSGINREGVSLLGISEAAEHIGFRTVGAKLTWEQLAIVKMKLTSMSNQRTYSMHKAHE